MRIPSKVTFAVMVILVTFALCAAGIREELRGAQQSAPIHRAGIAQVR